MDQYERSTLNHNRLAIRVKQGNMLEPPSLVLLEHRRFSEYNNLFSWAINK